jgi:hypothetical protein
MLHINFQQIDRSVENLTSKPLFISNNLIFYL